MKLYLKRDASLEKKSLSWLLDVHDGCVTSGMTLLCKVEATPFMWQGECLVLT